jgi:hypothetical protein
VFLPFFVRRKHRFLFFHSLLNIDYQLFTAVYLLLIKFGTPKRYRCVNLQPIIRLSQKEDKRLIYKPSAMKKFSFLSSVFLLVMVVTFLFIGCQKESAIGEEEVITTNSENVSIKSNNVTGSLFGSINRDYATALQNNFKEKYKGSKQTLQVAFSAKDLITFITNLQKKNNSDIIYVNFGVYGKGAPALDWKDNGRMTVFFTGNNKKNSGNVSTNDVSRDEEESFNHGTIHP